MHIKKRYSYVIIGLLILVIGVFTINAVMDKTKGWHDASNILVTVDGFTMTLQEAIINNVFRVGATQSYTTEIPNPGHIADELWVSVDGVETTLQDAISTIGLCGISSPSFSYSGPSDKSKAYNYANEIEISSDTSLQDAINSGELALIDGDWSSWNSWSSCSVSCGGGTQTSTRTCTNPAPYCGGAACVGDPSQSRPCNTQSCTECRYDSAPFHNYCVFAGGNYWQEVSGTWPIVCGVWDGTRIFIEQYYKEIPIDEFVYEGRTYRKGSSVAGPGDRYQICRV